MKHLPPNTFANEMEAAGLLPPRRTTTIDPPTAQPRQPATANAVALRVLLGLVGLFLLLLVAGFQFGVVVAL